MEKEGCCADFTADKICRGRAGYWNFVCAPFVLVWKSLTIFCFPCLHVLFWRCAQPLQVLRRGAGRLHPVTHDLICLALALHQSARGSSLLTLPREPSVFLLPV
jgi:hypothetical protein